jgi:hypothetical protein
VALGVQRGHDTFVFGTVDRICSTASFRARDTADHHQRQSVMHARNSTQVCEDKKTHRIITRLHPRDKGVVIILMSILQAGIT